MYFDGWSLIITCNPGPENIYVDMWPVYLALIAGALLAKLWKKAK